MGIGPIPYSSMRAYAAEYNIRGRDEFDYFANLLGAMDDTYVAKANSHEKEAAMIPISDVPEQHRMFARLQERAKQTVKK